MPINVTIIEDEKKHPRMPENTPGRLKNIRIIGAFQSGERAIDAIANNPPDAVLVDLELKTR